MKSRVTITLDPAVIRRAKTVARARQTNLSALIEDLLKRTADQSTMETKQVSFSDKWRGKFKLKDTKNDPLLEAMKTRYKLES
jgi:Family of unknown function (DUF6364)